MQLQIKVESEFTNFTAGRCYYISDIHWRRIARRESKDTRVHPACVCEDFHVPHQEKNPINDKMKRRDFEDTQMLISIAFPK